MRGPAALLRLVLAFGLLGPACAPAALFAAEATTGTIAGSVAASNGTPIAGAAIAAVAATGVRYAARSDARGRFTILGVDPGTYTVSASANGYRSASFSSVVVLPGETQHIDSRLATELAPIGSVRSRASAFAVGSASSTFAVGGAVARAESPAAWSSALGTYTVRTVQGAIAGVPGVQQDSFANAILRGGKVDDALFDYDSVPVPQGLIAEPGGNVVGAQLPTTGIATTTVTLAGYQAEGDNALGGIVNQIPAIGSYPGRTILELVRARVRARSRSRSRACGRRPTCAGAMRSPQPARAGSSRTATDTRSIPRRPGRTGSRCSAAARPRWPRTCTCGCSRTTRSPSPRSSRKPATTSTARRIRARRSARSGTRPRSAHAIRTRRCACRRACAERSTW